jgi:hypothetical protein
MERADLAQPPRLGLLLFVLGGCPASEERRTTRDIEAKIRQQKSEDRDAISNLLLKYPNAILATYV